MGPDPQGLAPTTVVRTARVLAAADVVRDLGSGKFELTRRPCWHPGVGRHPILLLLWFVRGSFV